MDSFASLPENCVTMRMTFPGARLVLRKSWVISATFTPIGPMVSPTMRDCGVSVVMETDCVPSLVIRISSKDARAVAAG